MVSTMIATVITWMISSWTIMIASVVKRRHGIMVATGFTAAIGLTPIIIILIYQTAIGATSSAGAAAPGIGGMVQAIESFIGVSSTYLVCALAGGALYAGIGGALVGGVATKPMDPTPVLMVAHLSTRFARDTQNQGLIIHVTGTKSADFTFAQAKCHVNGDQFWAAIAQTVPSAVVRLVQWTILPIVLCPGYLNPSGVVAGQTDFTMDIAIGTKERGTAGVLHETIRTQVRSLIDKGDPELTLRFESAKTNWNDPAHERVLFEWSVRGSVLLAALNDDDGHNLWKSSSTPGATASSSATSSNDEKKAISTTDKSESSNDSEKPSIKRIQSNKTTASAMMSTTSTTTTSSGQSLSTPASSSASAPATAAAASVAVPFVCGTCTFVNTTLSSTNKCSVCDTPRPGFAAPANTNTARVTSSSPDYSSIGSASTTSKKKK